MVNLVAFSSAEVMQNRAGLNQRQVDLDTLRFEFSCDFKRKSSYG
jgi:hypothetical protein